MFELKCSGIWSYIGIYMCVCVRMCVYIYTHTHVCVLPRSSQKLPYVLLQFLSYQPFCSPRLSFGFFPLSGTPSFIFTWRQHTQPSRSCSNAPSSRTLFLTRSTLSFPLWTLLCLVSYVRLEAVKVRQPLIHLWIWVKLPWLWCSPNAGGVGKWMPVGANIDACTIRVSLATDLLKG